VNHELNTLAQILKAADLWDLIEKHYKPLPLPNWTPPKVLTAEEEERFFRVVAGNPDWSVAYWAVSLTNNTSAMGIELRHLQMKHVFLEQEPPPIHIPDTKVKNEFRARVVPLNAVAAKQVRRIVERAKRLGAWHHDHYIFPYRLKRGSYDVTKPASPYFIRSAFRTMRKKTGLEWLQPRNFRNQIITKLFESGAPDEWAFVAPQAELFDARGNRIGQHGAGPYWQAADGSRTLGTAKARADAPSADAIPWLLLAARPDGPAGTFSTITSVQRVNTVGGKAPTGGCSASNRGATARVGYSADYHFYRPR